MEQNKNTMVKIIIAVAIVVIVVGLYVSGVFSITPKENNVGKATETENIVKTFGTSTGQGPSGEMLSEGGILGKKGVPAVIFSVEVKDGKFVPQETSIQEGAKVQVAFSSAGGDGFDVVFAPPFGKSFEVKKGGAVMFVFDASVEKKGEYPFSCKNTCPNGTKIEGKIVVR